MHIDNPQMRGLFFCGVTRQICRGYDRLRLQRSLCGGAAGVFYRNNRKNRHANSILTAERIINSWISALIGIIPNSFGTAERISKMPFFVSLLLFQYFKGHLRGEAANPHLIAFSLSPYSLQQQCCGFYVVASLEVQCDILTIKQEQLALCKLLLFW